MPSELAKKMADLAPRIMASFHQLREMGTQQPHLTMRHYQTLVILETNGPQTMTQLCRQLNLAASTGTELVNRMISLSFIEKNERERDRRQVMLSLAPLGRQVLRQRRDMLIAMFDRYLATLPQDDRTAFVDSFETIWRIIRNIHAE